MALKKLALTDRHGRWDITSDSIILTDKHRKNADQFDIEAAEDILANSSHVQRFFQVALTNQKPVLALINPRFKLETHKTEGVR
jgi:hypothetical protein